MRAHTPCNSKHVFVGFKFLEFVENLRIILYEKKSRKNPIWSQTVKLIVFPQNYSDTF